MISKQFQSLKRRLRKGFTLGELAVVTSLVAAAPAATYLKAKQKATETKCAQNLRQIGTALKMHEMNEGRFPKAAFYPKSATAKDSIMSVLASEGAGDKRLWTCPSLPDELQKKGLTFLYNDKLSGRSPSNPSNTWVLIEFCCLSKKAPAPHPGGYNVLMADGSVQTMKSIPADLAAEIKKVQSRKKKKR